MPGDEDRINCMNITLFISSLYGGGAERVTCNLASYLAEKGHQVEILTMAETDKRYPLNSKVSVSTLLKERERRGSLYNTISRIINLKKYMKQHKEKNAYIVMLPKTIIMMLAMRHVTKAKIIASERVDPAIYSVLEAKALRSLAHRADGYVFQTQEAMEWYGFSVSSCITEVIPNAINPEFICHRYDGERKKEIVAAGRLTDQKNFVLLIEAFSLIAGKYPEYSLTIYGEGECRSTLENKIEDLGLSTRISLPGNTPNLRDMMQNASMFVLSSDYEGMPNALMEAMALGLPCVSTDCPCGGPHFLIQDGENGLLVPVRDYQKMAEAMESILSDPALSEKLGKNAVLISERLNPKKIYGKWEKLILDVINN